MSKIQGLYTYKIGLKIVHKCGNSIRGLAIYYGWTTLEELHLRFLSRGYINLLVDSRYKGIISHPDIYLFYLMSIIESWKSFSFHMYSTRTLQEVYILILNIFIFTELTKNYKNYILKN